jgi:hypothetical protein
MRTFPQLTIDQLGISAYPIMENGSPSIPGGVRVALRRSECMKLARRHNDHTTSDEAQQPVGFSASHEHECLDRR